jgi:hypothetical protein
LSGKDDTETARFGKKYPLIQWFSQGLDFESAMWFIHSRHITDTIRSARRGQRPGK